MDLGITNIFIFYLKSWLILSIEISPPFFDHRLTLAIYFDRFSLSELIQKESRIWIDLFSKVPRYVPRFQELNKDIVLLHPFQESHHSVLNPTNTPQCSPQAVSPETQEYLRKVNGT